MEFAKLLGRAAMAPFSKALPPMGETERAALEAGTVGFEGRIFAGQPDFDALLKTGPNLLSAEEQAFLGNEAPTLCAMLDDFAIDQAHDMPPEVWQFLREKRFFGIIIPRQWCGPGFGHHAHATVVTRVELLPARLGDCLAHWYSVARRMWRRYAMCDCWPWRSCCGSGLTSWPGFART